MAYSCPKCSGPVQRGSSSVAGHAGGVVGMLLYSAFAGFNCGTCGKVEKSSFPDEVRSQMTRNSVLMGAGAVVLFGVVIVVIAALN